MLSASSWAGWVCRLRCAVAPHSDAARLRLVTWMAMALVILIAVLVVCHRGLWAPDELKYAQVVQPMHEVGDLFVLHLWGSVYTEKPPLFFWIARVVEPFTGGVYLATLLVPIVLAACVLLWVTGQVASRWYGARTGMFTVLVLVTLPLFLLLASIGRMDMLLALFVTVAVTTFYRGYVEEHRGAKVAAFVWMGVGLLAKGPFGIVFPLAIAVTALALSGKIGRLWCRESFMGLIGTLLIVASWLVPAIGFAGWGYLQQLLTRQLVARAVTGLDHGEPAYFYLWVLPIVLLPWVVFLFPSLRTCWRRWRARGDAREIWLLCWLTVPLIVLSLVREKLPVYLLPAMPPIAILIGRHWNEQFATREYSVRLRMRVGWLFVLAAMFGLIALATALLIVHAPAEPGVVRIGDLMDISRPGDIVGRLLEPQTLCFAGAALVFLAIVGWISMRVASNRSLAWTFGTLAAVAPGGQLFLAFVLMPSLDPVQSWRVAAEAIASAQKTGEPVITYGLRHFAKYYVNQDVVWFRKQDSLADLVGEHGAVWCATREDELDEIERACVVERNSDWVYPTPGDPMILVRLRPRTVAENTQR